jgi:hypothetical protein
MEDPDFWAAMLTLHHFLPMHEVASIFACPEAVAGWQARLRATAFEAELDRARRRGLKPVSSGASLDATSPAIDDPSFLYSAVRQSIDGQMTPLVIPLPKGFAWQVLLNSMGTYHRLCRPGGGEPLELGFDDPHAALPILRLAELEALVAAAASCGFDEEGARIVFSAVTFTTRQDDPRASVDRLARAIRGRAGLDRRRAAGVAARWGEPVSRYARWYRDDELGWLTTFPNWTRSVLELGEQRDRLVEINRALEEIGPSPR